MGSDVYFVNLQNLKFETSNPWKTYSDDGKMLYFRNYKNCIYYIIMYLLLTFYIEIVNIPVSFTLFLSPKISTATNEGLRNIILKCFYKIKISWLLENLQANKSCTELLCKLLTTFIFGKKLFKTALASCIVIIPIVKYF